MSADSWRLTDSETLRLFDMLPMLESYYRRHTSEQEAESLAMSTIIIAGSRFEHRSSLQHFVFGIAKHKVADFLRARSRRRARAELVFEAETHERAEFLPDPGAGPETLLDWQRRHERLDAALATVPEAYREVVRLCLDGQDNLQIAATLGLNYNTVRSRLSRGKAALRSAYGEVLEP